MTYKTVSAEKRFWDKVSKLDKCWEWTAGLFANGYGMFHIGKRGIDLRTIKAHRFSWELHYGGIPETMLVCHKCDNKKCVNPSHLFLGTPKDNMADMASKGRASRLGQPKLNRKQVESIRNKYKSGAFRQRALGELFGVSQSEISHIVSMKKWK